LKTNLHLCVVVKNSSNSTLLIQSSTRDANIQTPKMIQWDEINLPNEWLSENISKPTRVVNDISNLDYIQQYLDGSVKISFADLSLSNKIERPLLINERRNSFSSSTTTEGLQQRNKDIEYSLSHLDLKLKGISTNSQVSYAFYSTKTHPLTHADDEVSISPLASDFNAPLPRPHQCPIIHATVKDFFSQIDWPALQKHFSPKKNQALRHAYRAKFSKQERFVIKI
jgi:hypothetical protein